MKTRIPAILLILMLLASLLAGCQGGAGTNSTAGTTAGTTKGTTAPAGTTKAAATTTTTAAAPSLITEPGQFPVVNQDYTLSIMFPPNSTVTDYVDNDYTKYVKERTGITMDIQLLATENQVQQVELMVTSGEPLADIISVNLPAASRNSMYEQGIILPLDELYAEYAYWQPIMVAEYCSEREANYINMLTRTYDGAMLQFPLYYADPSNEFNPGSTLWLRSAWMESMNLALPTTTDELYDALVRIRDEDPNGNGQKDEIPLLGAGAARVLLSSFVYNTQSLNITDGKMWSPYITDEYRDGLFYLNNLVNEQLYSPTSFTLDSTQFNAIMNIEDSGKAPYVGVYCAHPTTTFDDASGRRLEYTGVYPIAGPKGAAYAVCNPNAQEFLTSVTKYCEDPEVAVRLLDSFCEREFMITSRWGLKDRDWIDLGEDKSGYEVCTYGAMGYETDYIYVVNPYGSSNNIIWKWDRATSLPPRLMGARPVITEDNKNATLSDGTKVELVVTSEYSKRSAAIVCQKVNDIPPEIMGKIMYTADEDMALADIASSLTTYIDECRTRFILGEMSIQNDWDSYIATLQSIGLQTYIDITQAAYTRMVESGSGSAGGAGIVKK